MFKLLTSTKLRDKTPAQGSSSSKRWTLGLVLAALALTAAACSSGTKAASSTTTTVAPGGSTATTSPSGSTPTTSGAGSSSGTLAVSTGTATSVGMVLTGPNGHTLYHLTTEKNGSIDCTGSCAQVWPPLTVSSGQTPMLGSSLGGTIGTVKRPDGTTQVTYNGEPLYYYAPDTSAGEAKGQGVGGVWFAVTPDSSTGSGSGSGSGGSGSTSTTSAPTTSTTTGGYSY